MGAPADTTPGHRRYGPAHHAWHLAYDTHDYARVHVVRPRARLRRALVDLGGGCRERDDIPLGVLPAAGMRAPGVGGSGCGRALNITYKRPRRSKPRCRTSRRSLCSRSRSSSRCHRSTLALLACAARVCRDYSFVCDTQVLGARNVRPVARCRRRRGGACAHV